MSFDLTNKNVSDTFQNLLQRTGSDNSLYDLTGNKITNLKIDGTLTVNSYITSQSILTASSGSTAFGNDVTDTHNFIGHISSTRFRDNYVINNTNGTKGFYVSGSTSINGNLNIGDREMIGGLLRLNNDAEVLEYFSSSNYPQGLVNIANQINPTLINGGSGGLSGNQYIMITGSNVGIGTSTATHTLEVEGNISASAEITASRLKLRAPLTSTPVLRTSRALSATTGSRAHIRFSDNMEYNWFDVGLNQLGSLVFDSDSTTDGNTDKCIFVLQRNGKVGILPDKGENIPKELTIVGDVSASGDVYVGSSNSNGVVLTSPNGTKYRLKVDNSGNLSTQSI